MSTVSAFSNLAFISYSRKGDGPAAARLQAELERYAVPLGLKCDRTLLRRNRYLRPIFRDHTDLNLHTPSWDVQLREELRRSRFLILLCSPTAASSTHVNQEVQSFLESHGHDSSTILPLVMAGDITAEDSPAACLPPALRPHREALLARNLPLAADCKANELMLKTAAWILRIEYRTLHAQFRHQQRQRTRAIVAFLSIAALVFGGLGWKVLTQRAENRHLDRQRVAEQERAERNAYIASLRQADRAIEQNQTKAARKSLDECPVDRRDWEWSYLQTELDQSLAQFAASDGAVPAAYSPDSRQVVVLAADQTIQVVALDGLKVIRRISTDLPAAHVIALSADGRWIAVGSRSDEKQKALIKVWEAESGREVWRIGADSVYQLQFSADGERLFASSPQYGAIRQFDVSNGIEGEALGAGGNLAGKFVLSKSADRVAALDFDGRRLMLFDPAKGRTYWNLPIGEARLRFTDLDISADGRYVIAATDRVDDPLQPANFGDGVWIVDAETGRKRGTLGDENSRATICRFDVSNYRIGVGLKDGTVECYEFFPAVGDARLSKRYPPHRGAVAALEFLGDLELLSAGSDHLIRSQVVVFENPPNLFRGHQGPVNGLIFLPRSRHTAFDAPDFLSWSDDGTVRIWTSERSITPKGKSPLPAADLQRGMTLVTPSPDGKSTVVRSSPATGAARLSGAVETDLDHAQVAEVAFSTDGSRIITASLNGTARVWNAADGSQTAELKGHAGNVAAATLDYDGAMAATGSDDKSVRLWDVAQAKALHVCAGHPSSVKRICFSRDGRLLASGDDQGNVFVWNVASGARLVAFTAHAGAIRTLAFAPRRGVLISAADDEKPRVWDVTDGRRLVELSVDLPVVDAAFNATGTRVFTLGREGSLQVWDAHTADEMIEIPLPLQQAEALYMHAEGSTVVVTDRRGTVISLTASSRAQP